MRSGTAAIIDGVYDAWDRHDAAAVGAGRPQQEGRALRVESSTATTSLQGDEAETRAGS
jgi:hypothetical protein